MKRRANLRTSKLGAISEAHCAGFAEGVYWFGKRSNRHAGRPSVKGAMRYAYCALPFKYDRIGST